MYEKGKCQLDPQHHIFVNSVIEDPLVDDELPPVDDPKYTDAVGLQQKLETCVVLKKSRTVSFTSEFTAL